MPARVRGAGLGLLLAAASSSLLALPDDRRQAIEIEAREAVREEASGLTVYQGNVTISQGTIEIRADKVSVFTSGNKVGRILAEGRPARYQQQPEVDSGLVVAQGNAIEYNVETDIILLTGNASLEQQEATLTGERIEYDLRREVIRAKGSDSGDDRIRMVIPPSQQQGTE